MMPTKKDLKLEMLRIQVELMKVELEERKFALKKAQDDHLDKLLKRPVPSIQKTPSVIWPPAPPKIGDWDWNNPPSAMINCQITCKDS